MENNVTNAACTSTTNLRQQQQQQQSQAREPSLTQKLQDQQHMQQQQQQQQQQQMHQQTSNTGSNSINNNNSSNNIENQQQFCLRWHNHQTSLLSTLPILLDQSHLTDVTISAEGRTLRAHRVVLSACSSFFLEIFRTLETTHHPVIIIPGASFAAIVALLTFMYSGEVNVYEEQIPVLLSLAETLGIKGLADVHNNLQKLTKVSQDTKETLTAGSKEEPEEKSPTPPSPQPTQSACGNFSLPQTPITAATPTFNPLLAAGLNTKFPSPLENFFLKSLQFYPNLMHHQPLNFSQAALNKTSELLTKYQQQCNLYQTLNPKDILPNLMHSEDESQLAKRFCSGLTEKKSSMQQQQQINLQQQKDIKRIDKIVENLRGANASSSSTTNAAVKQHEKSADTSASSSALSSHLHSQLSPLSIKTSMENFTTNPTNSLMASKSSIFSSPSPTADSASQQLHSQLQYNISAEDQLKLQQHLDKYAQSCARTMEAANESLKNDAARIMANEKLSTATAPQQSPQTKTPSNSKLYATCFICHKQLSNQYNLRVHLETHQNVRYACNVCSHVSRSKDALRKHVSYRHPGAPSPCETEARRKRANKVLAATQLNVANLAQSSPSSGEITPTSPNTLAHFQAAAAQAAAAAAATTGNTAGNELNCGGENAHGLTAAQLTSAYQMFMPNQFHLAAVAAQQQQQQQQQQLQQQQCSPSNTTPNKDFNNSLPSTATTTPLIKTENGTVALSETNSKLSLSTNTNQITTTTTTTTPTTTTTTQTQTQTVVSNSNTLTAAMEFQNSTNPTNSNNSGENRLSPSLNP